MAAHLAGGAQWTLVTYSYQSIVPDRVRGRVFGFDGALLTFTLSGSNTPCGWLAGGFSVRTVTTGVGAAVVVYSALVWLTTRRMRRSLAPTSVLAPASVSDPAEPERGGLPA